MQALTLVSTCLSICAALLALWVANNSGVRRLVKIQQRLDASLGLIISLQSRVNDLEKFSSTTHGFHIRGSSTNIDEYFIGIYRESDTGI